VSDEISFIDDTHRAFAEFAEMFLEEDERADFVDGMLERHGYQRQSVWAPPAPQQGGGTGRKGPLPAKRGGQGQGGNAGQKRSYFGGQGQGGGR
jgi:hypothetical protein